MKRFALAASLQIIVAVPIELAAVKHINKVVDVLLIVDVDDILRNPVSGVWVSLDKLLILNNLEDGFRKVRRHGHDLLPGEEKRVSHSAERVEVNKDDVVRRSPINIKNKVRIRELVLNIAEKEMLDIIENIHLIRKKGIKKLFMIPLGYCDQVIIPDKAPELPGRSDALKSPNTQDETSSGSLVATVPALHECLGKVVLDELAPFEQEDHVQRSSTAQRVVMKHPTYVFRR